MATDAAASSPVPRFVFGVRDPLESAIRAGDMAATLAALRGLGADERRARREGLLALCTQMRHSHWAQPMGHANEWGAEATEAQYHAQEAALVACGRPADLLELLYGPYPLGLDAGRLAQLCAAFGLDLADWRAGLQHAAEAGLRQSPAGILAVQQWLGAGLIERPQGESYLIGLMGLPRFAHWGHGRDLWRFFERDPGLFDEALQLFDVEGTAEYNLAAVDKYARGPASEWSHLFLQGLAAGLCTRAQLLDKTLDTLARDWPQFRAGWFSRFHQRLAPDVAEMTPRLGHYLALCHSRIPPTVTLALQALKALQAAGAAGDEAALLAALAPVMMSRLKGQLEAALKLVDAVVAARPALGEAAAAVCVAGLVHEAPEVQGKLLQRLARWGLDDAARARLAEHRPGVAAVHRPAFEALLGAEGAATAASLPAEVPPPPRGLLDPLDPSRALAPVADLQALIDLCAYVLENEGALDHRERAIEALVRLAPVTPVAQAAFAAVLKRARRLVKKPGGPAHELARLLLGVVAGERAPSWALQVRQSWPPGRQEQLDAIAHLALRIDDALALATAAPGLAPLEGATHERGFIAPAVLIERAAAFHDRGVAPTPRAQVQALLRLPARPAAAAVVVAARALPDTPWSRALRHALGDAVAVAAGLGHPDFMLERDLFLAAARVRCPGADDPLTLAAYGDTGPDAARAAHWQWQVRTRHSTVNGTTYTHHDLALRVPGLAAAPPVSPTALARQRLPRLSGDQDGSWLFWSFDGPTEAHVAYAASLMPGDLETHFAGAASEIGNNLRWSEARWAHHAYLRLMQDPTVPLRGMACLTLALALGAQEPGLVALAVDALLQGHAEGRLDAAALGATLRRLMATPLPLLARYRKSLQAAVRAEPRAAPLVFELLCEMPIDVDAEAPPKDLAALLELLLELALALGRPLPQPTRAVLGRLTLGAKGAGLRKALLSLPGPG